MRVRAVGCPQVMILLGVWYIDTDSIFKSVPDIKFGVFLSVRACVAQPAHAPAG